MSQPPVDSRWHPERDTNGRWIAMRRIWDGDLNYQAHTERDMVMRRNYEIANYYDLLAPCVARCAELNGEKS